MIPRAMLAVGYFTGRASHARQVKGDDPTLVLQVGGLAWGSQPHTVKNLCYESRKKENWMDLTMMERVGDRWKKWKDLV
jgi:hypothetical protein